MTVGGARHFYDRNGSSELEYWTLTTGNHSWTVRWTYTVPSNRIAQHSLLFDKIYNAIAAQHAQVIRRVSNDGGSTYYVISNSVHTPASGLSTCQTVTAVFFLYETDIIRAESSNYSGVNVNYAVGTILTEFDIL